MKKKMFLMGLLLLMMQMSVFAQSITITGTVKESNGYAIPGCYVFVQHTTNGTITDIDGKFSINAKIGDNLVLSFIGFATQMIRIENQKDLDITLLTNKEAKKQKKVKGDKNDYKQYQKERKKK